MLEFALKPWPKRFSLTRMSVLIADKHTCSRRIITVRLRGKVTFTNFFFFFPFGSYLAPAPRSTFLGFFDLNTHTYIAFDSVYTTPTV